MTKQIEKINHPTRVSLKKMARILNRCEKTFRKYVIKCEIPHIRLGRDLLFDVDEVERYLTEITMKKIRDKDSLQKNLQTHTKTKENSNKQSNKYAKLLGLS